MSFRVAKGSIKGPGFSAEEAEGPDGKMRVAVDRGAGMVEFPDAHQFKRIAREEGIPPDIVREAFGHMTGEAPGEAGGVYGSRRSVKLGHLSPEGKIVSGIVKGSLLVFDKASGEVFADFFESKKEGHIRTGSKQVTVGSALKKARKHGVPDGAFAQAFGHMLDPEDRRALSRR